MPSPLGPTQRLVLLVLDEHPRGEAPPTPIEIGDVIARRLRWRWWFGTPAQGAQIAACLRRLHTRGLVEKLGTAVTGANCWAITAAGRDVLRGDGDTTGATGG